MKILKEIIEKIKKNNPEIDTNYIKYPNGLMECWGNVTCPYLYSNFLAVSVFFPIPFINLAKMIQYKYHGEQ